MQIMRFEGVPKTSTITKFLGNTTPNLPSGVTGFARLKGLPSASMMLKIFPVYYYLIDENGDYITDEDGNRIETIM